MTDLRIPPRRAVVSVTGADATSLLSGLVTNGPPTDGSCRSALLTPQGKILFDFHIAPAPDGYLFDIDADAAEAFIKRLTLYRLRAKVDIGVDDDYAVCVDPSGDNGRVIKPVSETGGAAPDAEYDARRIAAGVSEWGADFDSDEVFPMDVNFDLLNGVDYKKGCFVGQEVASRMMRKGSARKRTLVATFDGPPPPKGTPVAAGASTLGHIMSGAEDAALALIRLDRWETAIESGDLIKAGDCEITLTRPAYMAAD